MAPVPATPTFCVVTGGVISGLGKGITSSSIALLLRAHGVPVTAIKIDPYLNVDAGTMSPLEHGECYVLEDGGETDLDLGNYERFAGINLTRGHNITCGSVLAAVLARERAGGYLGQTVQFIPHVTNEIKDRVLAAARLPVVDTVADAARAAEMPEANGRCVHPRVCMLELGGTLGDPGVAHFVEALRQLDGELEDAASSGRGRTKSMMFIHVVLVLCHHGEFKTKPAQQSVAMLRQAGIHPDVLVVRSQQPAGETIPRAVLDKLRRMCHVRTVVCNNSLASMYNVPHMLLEQGLLGHVADTLGLTLATASSGRLWDAYQHMVAHVAARPGLPTLRIGMVGKYIAGTDTYLSLVRALDHAAAAVGVTPELVWLDAEALEGAAADASNDTHARMADCHCLIIMGGFGARGFEGKVRAAAHARAANVPLLGICLGLQVMVVHALRGVVPDACSAECPTPHGPRVVDLLPGQCGVGHSSHVLLGGTMRLGLQHSRVTEAHAGLAAGEVVPHPQAERHRHRYEVVPAWAARLGGTLWGASPDTAPGLRVCAWSTGPGGLETQSASQGALQGASRGPLVEMVHDPALRYYVGCQFHPEYTSRFWAPHPLFVNLLKAANGAPQ